LFARRLLIAAAVCVVIAGVLALTHSVWLGLLGDALVADSAPTKADAALVLAGDYRGSRMRTAGELVRAGYIPRVFVSGPMDMYGINEAELAIRFAVENGYAREWFEPLKFAGLSTDDEARVIGAELEKRGVRNLLIVTSDFHTARAGTIFRRNVPSRIQLRMIGAPDKYFQPHGWWHTREGRKTWFFETTKTIADWFGI
jgi:uncharacterized SAM-binding protein YcdF (DUF218 family)